MDTRLDTSIIDELLSLCDDGDMGLLVELIDMFLDDAPSKIDAIIQGATGDDMEAVERAAHSLKGSSGNLGATELMDVAEQLQLASREGTTERVRELVPSLESNYTAADAALRELKSNYS